MEHGNLISTYFKDDGSRAKVYRITKGQTSFYSIAFFNSRDVMIKNEDFPLYESLDYVEAEAENWALGV